ncbi:hypothetical protein A3A66_03410 [Microgenomates group bacterium RIFCSPLOWO2_01_FULL_46_13]|nr:MAG: hypothetical protein A2783_04590 [Microgenomates group bacterium RIFCSPHIGHO2_01_FULL_45_11]OGV95040.1 MAG: hypothetical protein A3A66_03410 [Microgenomates group bacterium RIFCSPLOWO2_01_FULL_46_13]
MNRLILIDGHALLFRAFYAFPPLTTSQGELVNAVYGFTSILLTVIKELKPTHLAVSFDLAAPTFRHEAFKDYKAQRAETPKELIDQEARVRQVVTTLNLPIYEQAGFEADDVIGTLAEQAKTKEVITTIVTGDLDALQLVDDDPQKGKGKVEVFIPARGKKPAITYDEKAVEDRFGGLEPEQLIDYKALAGDQSDNIPGVKGIGPKTAIQLIKQFGSIENLYQSLEDPKKMILSKKGSSLSDTIILKLIAGKESAFQSKHLATIIKNVPLRLDMKHCQVENYDKEKVVQLFKELEFRSLINKLPNDAFEQQVQEVLF